MQHKLPPPLQVILMTGLLTLALLGPPSIAVADPSVKTSSHQVEPQEPHTDPIITPGAPSDLIFGTYLRSEPSSPDGVSYSIRGIGLDDADNIYVAGITDDPNFPVTPGLENEVLGVSNIFVAKFSPDGSNLIYSTLVGPVLEEAPYHDDSFGGRLAFAVGSNGAVYLTGATTNPNFPVTPGAYAVTCEAPCVFVTKLAPDGGIGYSTFLGGTWRDWSHAPDTTDTNGTGIAVDTAGDIYVGGYTAAAEFPTTVGAFQPTMHTEPNFDGFLVKLRPEGAGASDLVYGTYFGGPNTFDAITAITIDNQGVIYATGWTYSSDNASAFPTTPGAYDTTPPKMRADVDAFVLRLNPTGNGAADLLYSTYLGAEATYPLSEQDRGKAIAVDSSGAVYILGSTASDSFPTTPGAYRLASTASLDEVNVFLAKLRPLGSGAGDLEYATHVAEAYRDDQDVRGYSWRSLSVDDQGDVYIGGRIAENEQLATTLAAFDTDGGNSVVMRLRLAGQGANDLIYGSYFDSIVRVLTVVDTGEIALGGITNACDFPTTANAWQPNCAAGWIAGVAGMHTPERYLVTSRTVDPYGAPIANIPIRAG